MRTLLWVLLLGWAACVRAEIPAAPRLVVAFVFDWDDNIFTMPTRIMLYHRKTGEQRGVSTADFALIREQVGRPGSAWADFELRKGDRGSLRYFGDVSERGTASYQSDIDSAMKAPGWKGPVWEDFVAACSTEASARHTWIITARLHAPGTIHSALQRMVARGYVRHAPPTDNLWPVSHADFPARFARVFGTAPPGGGVADPSARKAAVMERILDAIDRTPLPQAAPAVLSPDGHTRGRYHVWGFSDDDLGNFRTAVQVLQRGVDAGRWPHVKITVFYTGTNRSDVRPQAVTLSRGQAPRAHREVDEWKGVLDLERGRLGRRR